MQCESGEKFVQIQLARRKAMEKLLQFTAILLQYNDAFKKLYIIYIIYYLYLLFIITYMFLYMIRWGLDRVYNIKYYIYYILYIYLNTT